VSRVHGVYSVTYQDCRVIWDAWRSWLLIFFLFFGDFDVFDIAASKDNVVKSLRRRGNEFVGLAVFCAERVDIFESYGRLFGVNLVKGADISMVSVSVVLTRILALCVNIPNFTLRYEVEPLTYEVVHNC